MILISRVSEKIFLLFFILIFVSGCCNKHFFRRKLYFIPKNLIKIGLSAKPFITIWIHGAKPFALNNYNLGLCNAKDITDPKSPGYIVHELSKADPVRYQEDNIYAYSWSGALDFDEREREAIKLHKALCIVVSDFKKNYNVNPGIRIIAHSHGGNIALNLAHLACKDFVIDELILLAAPIQARNYYCAQSSKFKRIFSFYSTSDITQIIDPQGLYRQGVPGPFFSERRFKVSENIFQVKTKLNGYACGHLDYNAAYMVSLLPFIIDQLNIWFDSLDDQLKKSEKSRFMLSIYTNGRKPPTYKRYYKQLSDEHILMSSKSS